MANTESNELSGCGKNLRVTCKTYRPKLHEPLLIRGRTLFIIAPGAEALRIFLDEELTTLPARSIFIVSTIP
jgi:hypothetical protein